MKNIRIEIKWSIIFIIAMLLWMLIERLTGLHDDHIDKHHIYTNLFAIPAILIFVLALIDKRKNYFGGTMTYKQGFITGLIISVFVTILTPVAQLITTGIITPDFFSNMIEHSVNEGKLAQEEAEKYFSTGSYIIQAMIGALAMGIATTAIVALFVRKNH